MQVQSSQLWEDFAVQVGFHPLVAKVLHELRYAYSVLDAFTTRFLPMYRCEFGEICDRLKESGSMEQDGRTQMATAR